MSRIGLASDDRLRRLALGVGVVVALGGSVWAAADGWGCAECRHNPLPVPFDAALLGVGFYSIMALLLVRKSLAPWCGRGMLAAGGVHIVLLGVMLRSDVMCPACVVTAGAALFGAGVFATSKWFRPGRDVFVLPLLALMTLGVIAGGEMAEQSARQRQIDALLSPVLREPLPEWAEARLVVFGRDGCQLCRRFEEESLPALAAEFGPALAIEQRRAPRELPVPTLVVSGRQSRTFVGLPPPDELERSLRRAIGEGGR